MTKYFTKYPIKAAEGFYDEPSVLDHESILELYGEDDIRIENDGSWDFIDDSFPWAEPVVCYNYDDHEVDDGEGSIQAFCDIIYTHLPDEPGDYHVIFKIDVPVTVQGVLEYTDEVDMYNESTYYTYDYTEASVNYDDKHADIKLLEFDRI